VQRKTSIRIALAKAIKKHRPAKFILRRFVQNFSAPYTPWGAGRMANQQKNPYALIHHAMNNPASIVNRVHRGQIF
jgi:hypothetical protein